MKRERKRGQRGRSKEEVIGFSPRCDDLGDRTVVPKTKRKKGKLMGGRKKRQGHDAIKYEGRGLTSTAARGDRDAQIRQIAEKRETGVTHEVIIARIQGQTAALPAQRQGGGSG